MYLQPGCLAQCTSNVRVLWYCVFANSLISIFTAHKMPLHEDSDSVVSGRGDGVVDDDVDDEVGEEVDDEVDDQQSSGC